MRAKKQSCFPGFTLKTVSAAHGGDLARGRRKTYRPVDPKQALHVVLRSSKARGALSMLHPSNCDPIYRFTRKTANRWGVRIFRYANVGNHIHLLIRVPSRAAWQRFLKELSGGIAMIVTGARKGMALARAKDVSIPESAKRGFWDHLAFTRIVSFGGDFRGVARYLVKNLFESAGVPMKRLLAQGFKILAIEKDGSLSGSFS